MANNKNPWDATYPSSLKWEMKAVEKPVHTILEDIATEHPELPCLDFMDKKYTYSEVLDLMHRFATGLQKMGVKKGDRVGLCLPNCPYYVVAYYAAMKVGATVVNFNPLYTEHEIHQQVEDSGITIMVALDVKTIYPKVRACFDKTSLKKIIYCPLANVLPPVKSLLFKVLKFNQVACINKNERNIAFNDVISHGKDFKEVKINAKKDVALFQYTGGTTGTPKAAMLSHSNVTSNAQQVVQWLKSCEADTQQGRDRYLAVLPFFHVFAMTAVLNMAISTGAEIIMLPRFDLKQALKNIHNKKPTIFPAVPTILNAINNFEGIDDYDFSSITHVISGGASLPKEVKEEFERLSGGIVVEGYGLSESSPVSNCNPPETGGKVGSIGLPLQGTTVEIRDLKDIKKKVDFGERGELVIKGPQVMLGYHNRKDETADTILKGGWLRTGDVGYMDSEGFVFLTDRLKEIIISNGYNVYPRVIEEAFYRHSDVEEVIVIGIPDDDKGEAPKAYVKLKRKSSLTEQELLEFACSKLNPIERPIAVEFRRELPKTLIGKLSKKELKEEQKLKKKA